MKSHPKKKIFRRTKALCAHEEAREGQQDKREAGQETEAKTSREGSGSDK